MKTALLVLTLVACNRLGLAPGDVADGGLAPVADGGQGWRWQTPLPQGNLLASVWASAEDDVWAAGAHGTLLHVTPSGMQVVASPSGVTDLSSIWGSAADDIWVAGASGTLLHWNGRAWSRQLSGTTTDLVHLWGSGAADVFAVGGAGTIVHFDGARWSPIPSGTTEPLTSVAGLGESDVWIGGGAPCIECSPRVGVLLHGSAAAGFTAVAPPPPSPVSDVWPVAAGDLWAAAQAGVTHFDGSTWSVQQPSQPFQISAFGTGAAWAVGGSKFYRFSPGSGWTPLQFEAGDILEALFALSDTAAWAVGADGLFLRWDGHNWSALSPPLLPTTTLLNAVWGSSSRDVYFGNGALGEPVGPAALYHFDGNRFSPVSLPQSPSGLRVVALSGSGANDVWLAATSYQTNMPTPVLDHFDGNVWSEVATPPDLDMLNSIYCPSAGTIWIAGASSSGPAALLGRNGGGAVTWTPADLPLGLDGVMTAVWGIGSAVFLAGITDYATPTKGIFFSADGDGWRMEQLPMLPTQLWGSAPDDLWAVGEWNDGPPSLAHRDASGWTLVPLSLSDPPAYQPNAPIQAIWGVTANEVYFVQRTGIWRWDGARWALDADLTSNSLQAVWGIDGTVFAVGDGGMILRRGN
jgi:hypothetical protein